jgi:hypothetical protein
MSGALQAAEKLNRSPNKCQGMTSVVPQMSQNQCGLYSLRKNSHPLKKLRGFVTGHDFSRAANAAKSVRASAPAKFPSAQKPNPSLFPQPV